jgi:hypothetical protein
MSIRNLTRQDPSAALAPKGHGTFGPGQRRRRPIRNAALLFSRGKRPRKHGSELEDKLSATPAENCERQQTQCFLQEESVMRRIAIRIVSMLGVAIAAAAISVGITATPAYAAVTSASGTAAHIVAPQAGSEW